MNIEGDLSLTITLKDGYSIADGSFTQPGYLLSNKQSKALLFNVQGGGAENKLYIWYKSEGTVNYLYYSLVPVGGHTSVNEELPNSPSVFGLAFKLNKAGHIIVGTVDTLTEG